jgi:uncharacterized membrane protein YbaN (DUF454 family)
MKKKNKDLKIATNGAIRQIWFICGLIATGLGIAGYILPVMPGTTFILIAVYCFARSNEKWHNKLLENKYFGQTIKDFKAGKGMSLKAKISAIVCIFLSISISMYFATNDYVRIFLIVCCVIATMCILYQKTKK